MADTASWYNHQIRLRTVDNLHIILLRTHHQTKMHVHALGTRAHMYIDQLSSFECCIILTACIHNYWRIYLRMYICSILVEFTPCYEVNHSVTTERLLRRLTANSSPGQAFRSSEVNRGKGFGVAKYRSTTRLAGTRHRPRRARNGACPTEANLHTRTRKQASAVLTKVRDWLHVERGEPSGFSGDYLVNGSYSDPTIGQCEPESCGSYHLNQSRLATQPPCALPALSLEVHCIVGVG